jgi:5-methylcytosine-specific restriction endonuclease McrBC regulatory subunit McrC
MARRSLGTEWFGYEGCNFTPPKSFGRDDDPNWHSAYRALFYLIGGFNSSKNISISESTEITKTSTCFLEYLLTRNIFSLAEKLRGRPRSIYKTRSELINKVRGKIDFHRTLTKGLGDPTKFVCQFHDLTHDDPIATLLKNGSRITYQSIARWLNEDNQKLLYSAVKSVENSLSSTKEKTNLHSICFQFLSGRLKSSEFKDVNDEARLIAYFLLYSQIGYATAEANRIKVDGVMLNLNRTFEKLLTDSLLETGKFSKDKDQLNDVYLVGESGKQKSSFVMRPDCKGYIEVNGQTLYLLLDAKHKLMSGDLPDEETGREISENYINRADLYQLISYAKTMGPRGKNVERRLAVIVGLNYEVGNEAELMNIVPSINITYGDESVNVLRVSMNFGFAMKMLGHTLSSSAERKNTLRYIGEQLMSAVLGADSKVRSAS